MSGSYKPKSSRGTKFYVSRKLPTANTFDAFEILWNSTPNPFKQVKGISNGGSVGSQYNMNTNIDLETGSTWKSKGSFDAGSQAISFPILKDNDGNEDPGQKIVRDFAFSRNSIAVKMVRADGSGRYYEALVGGDEEAVEDADTTMAFSTTFELSQPSIEFDSNGDEVIRDGENE